MKKILTSIALLVTIICTAQDNLLSDVYNTGGTISDYGLTTRVVTYPVSGVGYLSTLGGVFEHYGPTNNGSGVGTLDVMGHFDATGGRDDFYGPGGSAGAQQITGNTAPTFGILNFNNGSASQLNILNTMGINVAGQANYLNGITTTVRSNTSAGAMRFNAGAFYTGSVNNILTTAGADAQHVNGYVGKTGNTSFIYPVGSGTDARSLQISAPSSATDEYDVAWIAGNPSSTGDPSNGNVFHPITSVTGPIISVSPVGQWDWVPVSGTGAGLTITVSIPNMTAFAATANLRLVGWNGSTWIDLSGTATASGNNENNILAGTMIAGITAIGIGSISFPLPLTLVSFDAVKQGVNTSLLKWVTVSESNTAGFMAEHSVDGIHYSVIGVVLAAGNSNTLLNYSLVHNNPARAVNYYRLKMIDIDGRFTYSPVRILNFNNAVSVIVAYPNPATNRLVITGIEAGMQLRLVNAWGQLLINMSSTGNTMQVDIEKLPSSTYVLQVVRKGEVVHTIKIVKE
ncbi:MAG: T9SS type A sorting domain-containing protein [Chitinophagaceae bacterium]